MYKLTSITPVYAKVGNLYTYTKVESKPTRSEILSSRSLTSAERKALLSYYGYKPEVVEPLRIEWVYTKPDNNKWFVF